MGRRLLKINLTQPLTNSSKIISRYNFIKLILESNYYIKIEELLTGINDIEKQNRKISLNIINPIEFYTWINSISNSLDLLNYMLENKLIIDGFNISDILIKSNYMLASISKYMQIEELQKYLINDIDGPIFQPKIYADIDLLNCRIAKCSKYMDAITYGLNNYLDSKLQTKTDGKLLKMEYNERDGHYILLTKRRCEVLETILKRDSKVQFTYENLEYEFSYMDLEFKHLPKGNNSKIFIKEIERNSVKMIDYKDELKLIQKEYYIKFLSILSSRYDNLIEQIYQLIAEVDYLKSGAKCSVRFHYSIPTILNKLDDKIIIMLILLSY
jgi:DNA mismatch repair ATPase MutS